jgi:hypothetical protein
VEFYGDLVTSATCRNFIKVKKGVIEINTEFVTEHLELNAFKNETRTRFSPEAPKHCNIQPIRLLSGGMVDVATLGLDDGLED